MANTSDVRVLIVDDHPAMRQGLTLLLRSAGYGTVDSAENGREALKMCLGNKPDVVVMDITMPDLNGIDATQQMLTMCPDAKVLAFSASEDERTVGAVMRAGARGFLTKGSAFEELATAVEALLAEKVYVSPKIARSVVNGWLHGKSGADTVDLLTPREREVLQLTAEGLAMKEIAAKFNVSVKTIETHRKHLMDKLGLHTVAELTKFAVREHITPN